MMLLEPEGEGGANEAGTSCDSDIHLIPPFPFLS